jgi:hypothetical protein
MAACNSSDGAGHHLPRRAPDAVADAIVAFLAAAKNKPPGMRHPASPSEDGVALRQPSFWPIRWRSLVLQTRTAVADDASPAAGSASFVIETGPVTLPETGPVIDINLGRGVPAGW